MYEAVASRLKTAAKVKSLALLHKDCFKIFAKVANCWRINLHCCRASKLLQKLIIFPVFQKFSLHLRDFWLRVASFNVYRDISIYGNPWVSIFATCSERVVHAKVVPSSHAEEITFEHKCNIIEMTWRREWEVVEGKEGCLWRGSCVPPKSLKAVGSWKQKRRVMSLIKIGIQNPAGPSTSGGNGSIKWNPEGPPGIGWGICQFSVPKG